MRTLMINWLIDWLTKPPTHWLKDLLASGWAKRCLFLHVQFIPPTPLPQKEKVIQKIWPDKFHINDSHTKIQDLRSMQCRPLVGHCSDAKFQNQQKPITSTLLHGSLQGYRAVQYTIMKDFWYLELQHIILLEDGLRHKDRLIVWCC